MNANTPAEPRRDPIHPPNPLPAELTSFAARREARARELAAQFDAQLPPVIWAFFGAATNGSWPEVARLGEELRNLALSPGLPKPNPALISQVWSAIMEIYMGSAQFALGVPKYAFAFGRGIIASIPPGSVYFGGTDAGRGLVTVLCPSQETGDPFFTLTQNGLASNPYLRYLREIYGSTLFIPSEADLEQAWAEYFEDFQRRRAEQRLIPGEMAEAVDGKIQSNSQITIMSVNGALAKLIFERNPDREFFVEESFRLNWMHPHLAPHGLIMRISREPLQSFTPEQIAQDAGFWSDRLAEMLGDWLRPESPVSDICAFAEKIYLLRDLSGFAGDPAYVPSEAACLMFSKLRTSIAGVYAGRARSAADPGERRRMADAADFAFRQAFALDPRNPEAVFGYANHLMEERRLADALLLAETASKLAPEISRSQIQTVARYLAKRAGQEKS